MRKRYEKPVIASERVFTLTSQACDVCQTDWCFATIMYYKTCPSGYKVQMAPCGPPPPNPVAWS